MLPANPRRRGRGRGEGHYAHDCISIPRPMALNLALLNDYRTCKCTMHRHTAPVVFIPVSRKIGDPIKLGTPRPPFPGKLGTPALN